MDNYGENIDLEKYEEIFEKDEYYRDKDCKKAEISRNEGHIEESKENVISNRKKRLMEFYKYKDYLLGVKILDNKGNKKKVDEKDEKGNDLKFDESKLVKEVKI